MRNKLVYIFILLFSAVQGFGQDRGISANLSGAGTSEPVVARYNQYGSAQSTNFQQVITNYKIFDVKHGIVYGFGPTERNNMSLKGSNFQLGYGLNTNTGISSQESNCCKGKICKADDILTSCNALEDSVTKVSEDEAEMGKLINSVMIKFGTENVIMKLKRGNREFCSGCYQNMYDSSEQNMSFAKKREEIKTEIVEDVITNKIANTFKDMNFQYEKAVGLVLANRFGLDGDNKGSIPKGFIDKYLCRDKNKFSDYIEKNSNCVNLKNKLGNNSLFEDLILKRQQIAMVNSGISNISGEENFDNYFGNFENASSICTNRQRHLTYTAGKFLDSDVFKKTNSWINSVLKNKKDELSKYCSDSTNKEIGKDFLARLMSEEYLSDIQKGVLDRTIFPKEEQKVIIGDENAKFLSFKVTSGSLNLMMKGHPHFGIILSSKNSLCERFSDVSKSNSNENVSTKQLFSIDKILTKNEMDKLIKSEIGHCDEVYNDFANTICLDSEEYNPSDDELIDSLEARNYRNEKPLSSTRIALESTACEIYGNVENKSSDNDVNYLINKIQGTFNFLKDWQTNKKNNEEVESRKQSFTYLNDLIADVEFNDFAKLSDNIKGNICNGFNTLTNDQKFYERMGIPLETFDKMVKNPKNRYLVSNDSNNKISHDPDRVVQVMAESVSHIKSRSANRNNIGAKISAINDNSKKLSNIVNSNSTIERSLSNDEISSENDFMKKVNQQIKETKLDDNVSTYKANPISDTEIKQIISDSETVQDNYKEVQEKLKDKGIDSKELNNYLSDQPNRLPEKVQNDPALMGSIDELKNQIADQAEKLKKLNGDLADREKRVNELEDQIKAAKVVNNPVSGNESGLRGGNSGSLINSTGSAGNQISNSFNNGTSSSGRQLLGSVENNGTQYIKSNSGALSKFTPKENLASELKSAMISEGADGLYLEFRGSYFWNEVKIDAKSLKKGSKGELILSINNQNIPVSDLISKNLLTTEQFKLFEIAAEKSNLEDIVIPSISKAKRAIAGTIDMVGPTSASGATYQGLMQTLGN